MSRPHRIYAPPTRATISATLGTIVAASAIATALAMASAGPAKHSASGHGPYSPSAADLARAADQGANSSAPHSAQAEAQSARAVLMARQAAALRRAAVRHAQERAAARRTASQAAAERAGAPRAATPSGTPQQIAITLLGHYGWSSSQFGCLNELWTRESGWNTYATNPSSGAYGIPQSLPGSKMASAGADWQTNPATQIRWGLGYIQSVYGSPCGAWGHETSYGWY